MAEDGLGLMKYAANRLSLAETLELVLIEGV